MSTASVKIGVLRKQVQACEEISGRLNGLAERIAKVGVGAGIFAGDPSGQASVTSVAGASLDELKKEAKPLFDEVDAFLKNTENMLESTQRLNLGKVTKKVVSDLKQRISELNCQKVLTEQDFLTVRLWSLKSINTVASESQDVEMGEETDAPGIVQGETVASGSQDVEMEGKTDAPDMVQGEKETNSKRRLRELQEELKRGREDSDNGEDLPSRKVIVTQQPEQLKEFPKKIEGTLITACSVAATRVAASALLAFYRAGHLGVVGKTSAALFALSKTLPYIPPPLLAYRAYSHWDWEQRCVGAAVGIPSLLVLGLSLPAIGAASTVALAAGELSKRPRVRSAVGAVKKRVSTFARDVRMKIFMKKAGIDPSELK